MRNRHPEFSHGGRRTNETAFDFDMQDSSILRISPPAAHGEPNLRGGLLSEPGQWCI
jgi:hypothetical protein